MSGKAASPVASPRAARTLAEFVNLQTVGAAIFGRISNQGKNGNGAFVVFEPAAYRAGPDAPFVKYAQLATGLSTDLASKVSDDDTGRVMLFYLAGFKPTNKTPMKIFNVVELTPAQAGELFASNAVSAAWTVAPSLTSKDEDKGAARAVPDLF